jgi:flagellar motor switch/type III secretory pathway protein FliN
MSAEAAVARQTEGVRSAPAVQAEAVDWAPVLDLPLTLTVDVVLPGFKVRDLMRLQKGTVIPSQWLVSADVGLRANGELIAWSEFEVVGSRLAVRLTELA